MKTMWYLVHGNFTRTSHDMANHYSLLELCDIQECDYLGQSHAFNAPENRSVDGFKYYYKQMKEKTWLNAKIA